MSKSKRILVLDDEEYRHRGLAKKHAGELINSYVSAKGAISALAACREGSRFDVVYLDHDLGDGHGDGRDVANYIAQMPPCYRPREVVVHSWNMPAGAQMMAILAGKVERLRREPFQWPGDEEEGVWVSYEDEDEDEE